ncbi:MAG: hypothetical protein ACOWWH_08595 [Eubacteriaceae bacterium]
MKRITSILLVLMVMFFMGSISYAASDEEDSWKIIYQKDEVTDLDILFEKAKKEITDKKISLTKVEFEKDNHSLNEFEFSDGKLKPVIFSTTQKLNTVRSNSGVETSSYVTTDFVILSSGGTVYDYTWDGSYGVKAYTTTYWTGTNTSPQEILIDRVTGGWTISDYQLSVSNKHVRIGNNGWTADGSIYRSNQIMNRYPSGMTFNYYTPSSWGPTTANSSYDGVGVNTYCTITRGSETYTLHHQSLL